MCADTSEFLLTGQVHAEDFGPWIARHAAKLGLTQLQVSRSGRDLKVRATGAPEMRAALAVACSLGPRSVLVDQVIPFSPETER